jgi:endoplasmic reticulum protein 29
VSIFFRQMWPGLWTGASFLLLLCTASAAEVKGCLELDNVTFSKLVGTPDFNVLVKFDKSYPYGDKEDEFKAFAKTIGQAPGLSDLLVTAVLVDDYGSMQNDDLRRKYDINVEAFPAYRAFHKSSPDPVPYPGAVTANDLLAFVKTTFRVWIGLPGCLERYDALADGFLSLPPVDQQDRIRRARDLLAVETDAADRKAAEHYLATMAAVAEKGAAALEDARASAKTEETRNVVASFTKYRCKSGRSGCLREMDAIVAEFTAPDADRAVLYERAKGLVYGDGEDQANARVYLTVLGRLLEKGPEYIPGETARLKKLLGSQVSDKKKAEFNFKLHILDALSS